MEGNEVVHVHLKIVFDQALNGELLWHITTERYPYEFELEIENECIHCREKLAPVKLNMFKDDILFFMFYTNVGDVLQLAAAAEL